MDPNTLAAIQYVCGTIAVTVIAYFFFKYD
jgi:hypothetical protein